MSDDLEVQLRAYAERRRLSLRRAQSQRYRAKRKENPVPCSNCGETKPTHVDNPPTCGACYIYQHRHGKPRPPAHERPSAGDLVRLRYAARRGYEITPAVVATWCEQHERGATVSALARAAGLSYNTMSKYLREARSSKETT